MTYDEFLKTVNQSQLGADGRYLGAESGVNRLATGLTPQQWYDQQTQGHVTGGWDNEYGRQGGGESLDTNWIPGAKSGGGFFGGTPPWLLAAFAGAGYMANGAAAGAAGGGAESLAGAAEAAAPNAGMSLADQYAAYGAGGGGVTGGLTTGTVGGFTGAAGGDFLVNGMPSLAASEVLKNAKDATPLGSVAQFLKDNPLATQIGGALLGAAASGDKTQTQTSAKDPWAPAQEYLKDNLKQNAAMQAYYRANPFSTEQKNAYQGLLDTNANAKANVSGLLSNANAFQQSKRGVMPAMTGLLSGTKADPIDWAKYSNIGG